MTLIEACVGSLSESLAAEHGGAHRLELCDRLDVGGTTPSAALIDDVKRRVQIPVSVMIRPRGGSFVHTATELDQMRRDIEMAREHGADMLVIGPLTENALIDVPHVRELVALAQSTPVTFHRAFDEIRDQRAALEQLVDAGVARILTGGGPNAAIDNVDSLARLVAQAGERITIMAAGKVRAPNAKAIVDRTGVSEVHARCELDSTRISEIVAALS